MGAAFTFRMRMMPVDVVPIVADVAALRRQIEDEIGALIEMLDTLDGDADLEDGGDGEPSLGWTATMALGDRTDREEDACVLVEGFA